MKTNKNLILFSLHGKKGVIYKYVGVSNKKGKPPIRRFSLGNLEKLLEINPEAVEILKWKLKFFSQDDDPEYVKAALLESIKSDKIKWKSIKIGGELIEKILEKHKIFESIKKTKHKNMHEIFQYLVTKRIIDPDSILKAFNKNSEYSFDISTSKNSFYRLLDIIHENRDNLLIAINNMINLESNRKLDQLFFDSSTVYFETFNRNGYRNNGYSKDGKFKEDQIVIALACDQNGIPFHFKIYTGNIPDAKTMIPFMLEIEQKYKIIKENITIIADRGMSSAGNIRFLEQKGYKFIISYRAKSGSTEFKKYIKDQSDYKILNNSIKYKTQEYFSTYKNKRQTENIRKKLITFSKSRAQKDKKERQNLIESFLKKQKKDGSIDPLKMLGSKKCKFFRQISNFKFELDEEKVKKDQEFDGIYIYETNLINANPEEIIETYSKQWRIEENFRSLKSLLEIRPVYVSLDSHIYAHTLICFLSLAILKLFLYKINNFYKENGVIHHLTQDSFVQILQEVKIRAKIDENTGKIIRFKRENISTIKNIWETYDEYKKIVMNNF